MGQETAKLTGPSSKWLHLIRYFRDPLGHYQSLQKTHGDPFKVPFLLGNEMVVTGQPEGIRAIFSGTAEQFVPVDLGENPFFGKNGLTILAGEEHRRARRLMSPHFRGQRIKCYGQIIQETFINHAKAVPADKPVTVVEMLQRVSLEIILRTIFGVVQPRQVEEFGQAVIDLRRSVGFWVVFVPALRRNFGPWSPWARFIKARDRIDFLIYEQIKERRAAASVGDDILSQMVSFRGDDGEKFSDEQIRDNLLTLLAAGQSTSATAMAWAIYWICSRPDVAGKLQHELKTLPPPGDPDALANLPYLDAICKETLRIKPIAAEVARRLKEPMEIAGHIVAPGAVVSASVYLSHYNTEIFPDPTAFKPERFLERNFTPYEYFPFGGGVRICIGSHLAAYLMRVIIGTLYLNYDVSLVSKQTVVTVWKEGIMEPKGGVQVMIKPNKG